MDVAYSKNEWEDAIEAAELYDFCDIDAGEKHGPLAGWIAREYSSELIECDIDKVRAAVEVAFSGEREGLAPERLVDILNAKSAEVHF
jgi:hypothetical protein